MAIPLSAAAIFGAGANGPAGISPLLRTGAVYDFLSREGQLPQKPDEPDFVYALRRMFTEPVNMMNRESESLAGTIGKATSTPNSRAQDAAAMAKAKPAAQAQNTGAPAAKAIAADFSRDAVGSMVDWVRNRGGNVTSWDRNAAHNKQVGGVGNSYHLTGRAFDSTPPGGMKMAEWHQELKAKYPGWDVINEGDHVHVEPPGGAGGSMEVPGFVNPFDSTYHNQALAELNRGQAAALQPQTLGTREAAPEIPDLMMPAKADFSQADQWLADMKPAELMETEKRQIERDGWFKGLAQAAASISGGEGIGTMFLRLGAGSLGGRMAGKDEVRARMDQFDKKMAQWQLLNFQNEGNKANVVAQEARQEAAMINEHAMNKFRVAYSQWEKDGPQVVGDAVITTKVGEDGTRTITRTPLQGPIMSAFALHRAQTLSALGGLQNNGNSMVASATNGLLANEAQMMFYQSLSGGSGVSGQEAQDALVTAQASAATNAVKFGRLADIIAGEDDQKSLFTEVDTAMQGLGLMPGSNEYAERREMMIAERLLRVGLQNKEVMERIMNAGGAGLVMSAAERFQNRTERRSVDSKGRPTSSTTYRGEE